MDRRAKAHLQRANELLSQLPFGRLNQSSNSFGGTYAGERKDEWLRMTEGFNKRLKETKHIWLNADPGTGVASPSYKDEIHTNTLDVANLKKKPGYADFKVRLELIQVPNQPDETMKMTGVVARKAIAKGEIVAYYKMRVFQTVEYEGDMEFYSYPNGTKYTFTVYDKDGLRAPGLIGDLSPESVPDAIDNAPFFAHLVNEPNTKQTNVAIDKQTSQNFGGKRESVQHGDFIVYALVATKKIEPGEQLLYCYGLQYERDYKTGCSS